MVWKVAVVVERNTSLACAVLGLGGRGLQENFSHESLVFWLWFEVGTSRIQVWDLTATPFCWVKYAENTANSFDLNTGKQTALRRPEE